MAVPSSGELELYGDIGTELGVAQSNVTLHGMSQTAGFSTPDAMSEFYGYSAGSSLLSTVIYTGNATARSITGVGFQPDLVWIKNRDAIQHHNFIDSVRGNTKLLYSSLTNAEATTTNHITSFDADGFSLGTATSANGNGNDIVAWCFKAGGAAVTNTDGTITSQVSANVAGGFSIVTYTGNGANGTVGHGLGVTPNIVLTKARTMTSNWSFNGNYGGLIYGTNKFALNLSAGLTADTNEVLAANSSTFTAGTSSAVGRNGEDYVAYVFAEKSGISKFGSYNGNNTAGNKQTTGFEPSFIIFKITNQSNRWFILDNKRDANPHKKCLNASSSEVEFSNSAGVNFLSDGFDFQGTSLNNTGLNFTYMAFA